MTLKKGGRWRNRRLDANIKALVRNRVPMEKAVALAMKKAGRAKPH